MKFVYTFILVFLAAPLYAADLQYAPEALPEVKKVVIASEKAVIAHNKAREKKTKVPKQKKAFTQREKQKWNSVKRNNQRTEKATRRFSAPDFYDRED